MRALFSRATSFVRESDEYGHSVHLTYKDEETHKTLLGGTISVIARVVLIYWLYVQFVYLSSQKNTVSSIFMSNDVIRNP